MDVEDYAFGIHPFWGKNEHDNRGFVGGRGAGGGQLEVLGDRGGLYIDDDDNAPQSLIIYTQRGDKLVEEAVGMRKSGSFRGAGTTIRMHPEGTEEDH